MAQWARNLLSNIRKPNAISRPSYNLSHAMGERYFCLSSNTDVENRMQHPRAIQAVGATRILSATSITTFKATQVVTLCPFSHGLWKKEALTTKRSTVLLPSVSLSFIWTWT